jgi:hypothetical protein
MDFSCSLPLHSMLVDEKISFHSTFFIFSRSLFLSFGAKEAKEKLKYEFLISHTWENVKTFSLCDLIMKNDVCVVALRGRLVHTVIKVQMLHFFPDFFPLSRG